MRVSLYIPQDIYDRLKKHGKHLNWSAIAQAALIQALDQAESERRLADDTIRTFKMAAEGERWGA